MADPSRRVGRELLLATMFGPRPPFDAETVMARVLEEAEELDVAAGDVLMREGEPSDHLVIMIDGRVRLTRPGLVDWVYRGRWALGATDAILRRPRRRTVVVEVGSRMLRFPAARYLDVMEESQELVSLTLPAVARAIEGLLDRLGAAADLPVTDAATAPAAPLTLAARVELLGRVPLLAGGAVQGLAELAAASTVDEHAAGAQLITPGRSDPRLLVVSRGKVALERAAAPLHFGPGTTVGAAVWSVARDAVHRAVAVEPTTIVAVPLDAWLDRFEEHPSLGTAAIAALSAERERLQEVLAERLGELVLD